MQTYGIGTETKQNKTKQNKPERASGSVEGWPNAIVGSKVLATR